MHVYVHLTNPPTHYTNLDEIQGYVDLRIPAPTNLSSVVVKLEGESRTRLLAPVRPDRPDKQRPVLEVHKFLYRTQIVWPPNLQQGDASPNPKASYAIESGGYEFPFKFKIPLNTQCQQHNSLSTNVSFSNMALEVAKTPTHHVKTTLPPTLGGFPGEAEIRYYVKVTVNRPRFFQENPRAIVNFTFLPLEPPRPAESDGEAYARRQHQFLENAPNNPAGKRKGLLDKLTSMPTSPTTSSATTPRVSVDARLPNPAILTANHDVPLRLLIKNLSERTKNIYLQMLQVELIGFTKVRSHEVSRTESSNWVLASMSDMAIPIGSPSDPVGTEIPVNPEYWAGKLISNSVPPTFQACNISRHYELEVKVGLGYASYMHGEDQLVILPLRLPVKVYSGIAPPKALLDATLVGRRPGLSPPSTAGQAAGGLAPAPASSHQGPAVGSSKPGLANAGAAVAAGNQGVPYDEAPPPSYEEAIGQDLPPINGYRGSYQPPPVDPNAPRMSSDEKRR